jgi:hypothetical protein
LDGIEAGADVTDATNVSAAGAVMKTLVDAKGDLLVATAADTVTRLPIGVSNGQVLIVDSAETTGMKWVTPSVGDVVGPASSTDNAFARFDSTTGKLLQNSTATLDDIGLASVDGVQFSTTPTSTVGQAKAVWDTTDSCLSIGLNASVNALVGVDSHVKVRNKSTSTMTVMQVVRQSGSSGTRLDVELALANTDAASANTIGVVAQTIASNAQGFIQTAGLIRGVDTNAFTEGDTLWLSATTAGLITNVKPTAPNHGVRIGYCIKKAGGAGIILIDILNGFELDELHDVKITAPIANNSFLAYNTTSSVWENKVDVPAAQLTGTIDNARLAAQITGRTSFDATNGTTKDSSLSADNLSFTDSDSGMLISIQTPTTGNQVFLTWPSATGVLLTDNSSLPAANLTGTINTARLPATITGLTSVTSTTFVGALTGTASGNLVAGGALGTPSSATLTNATGLPAAGVVGTALTLGGGTLTGALTLPNVVVSDLSLTGSQATNTLSLATTWNTTGNPALIYGRVTNTASGASANLLDLGTAAGGSLISISKAGFIKIPTLSSATTPAFAFTDSGASGWFSPSNGVIYYGGSSRGVQFGLVRSGNGTVQLAYNGRLEWTSGAADTGTLDTYLSRSATATLQMGVNAASTATAQTIKAHDVTTGTGADLILKGGTGSSANGNVRFGTHSAWAAEVISGYITIRDESGTLRKLAVIS